ncbi:bifunctional 5,10-methylene-tetrahydrofolate dehydrogenase/5,10-methylene-tetrahydrofolate cyclohydrolase, partial [Ruminococcaceae bacterium OttesenSCG-928-N02]|nr:bifunctional 5,10-methylene-tetrahydrofolate dehydrogenase/5,10-methylene-tetrahydrofolate cyclohydrolase [Ruminococcaceae bacterium OttesenSCG-928-N02]
MARVIEGAPILQEIKTQVSAHVQTLKAAGVSPCLCVVMLGDNPASAAYVRGKEKDCAQVGIESTLHHLPAHTTQQELLALINTLNEDPAVHGVLVQLPLPAHMDEAVVLNAVSPSKDVDGFTPYNMGRLFLGQPAFVPCTARGVVDMLKWAGTEIAGKHCVVIGRSNIVGKPLAVLLSAENGTVTLCHSKTQNLKAITNMADILVCAVGNAGFITADMVKPGAVVVDVGITRGEDGKLHGDVDFDAVSGVAGAITPVPGGVGLLTRG